MRSRIIMAVLMVALTSRGNAAPPDHAGGPGGHPDAPGQVQNNDPPPTPANTTPDNPAAPGNAGTAGRDASRHGRALPKAPTDQNEAQRALKQDEALPLSSIVMISQRRDQGRVINARLVRIDGVLLYQLTLLNEAGKSWRSYYLAKSGNPVELR